MYDSRTFYSFLTLKANIRFSKKKRILYQTILNVLTNLKTSLKSASWSLAFLAKDMFTTQLLLGFFLSYFQNMFFYCSNVVFQSWMDKKRVFGNATVFCGVPLGAMVLSPLWVMLIEKFSWRGCCLIQGKGVKV